MRYDEILANLEATSDGCREWRRARLPSGYGVVNYEGRNTYVHRVAYEQAHGPIADGLEVDHLCRNRACANPDHLEAVTHAENRRRSREARTHCANGHAYEGNTYVLLSGPQAGDRRCRTCHLANVRRGREEVAP